MARSAQLPGSVGASLDQLFSKQELPFDRRWPAVLRGIEFRLNGVDNAFGENLYTAAVWRAVLNCVISTRAVPEVQRIKSSYVIGFGDALTTRKLYAVNLH